MVFIRAILPPLPLTRRRPLRKRSGGYGAPRCLPVDIAPAPISGAANARRRPHQGRHRHDHRTAHIAAGEKAKARDIIAAIRTLQAIEREHRPATSR